MKVGRRGDAILPSSAEISMRRGLIPAAVNLIILGVVVGWASAGDAPPVAPPAPPAPAPKAELPRQTIDLGNGVTFEMVLIREGGFDMGSPGTERDSARRAMAEELRKVLRLDAAEVSAVIEGWFEDEPRRRVRLTRPYWVASTETTQAVWEAVMGSLPSSPTNATRVGPRGSREDARPSWRVGPTFPVIGVSWQDCIAFLEALNERVSGAAFRLPTEAEWEHACRAGTATWYTFGDDPAALPEHGWYEANSGGAPHPVGRLKPNAWGLYDVHGNVSEWCSDLYSDCAPPPRGVEVDPQGPRLERVVRGGNWWNAAPLLRCACRGGVVVTDRGRGGPQGGQGYRSAGLGGLELLLVALRRDHAD